MRPWCRAAAAAVAACAAAAPAFAEEITVTPRVWLYFDDVLVRSVPENITQPGQRERSSITREPFLVPMYGGSVSYFVDSLGASVTGTAMYGAGTEEVTSTIYRVSGPVLTASDIREEYDFQRTDIELTAQKEIAENVGLLVGVRYEVFRADTAGTETSFSSQNSSTIAQRSTFVGERTGEHNYDSVSIRGGLSMRSSEIDYLGGGALYGNAQAFAGWRRQNQDLTTTGTTTTEVFFPTPDQFEGLISSAAIPFATNEYFVGPDVSVGFLKQITDKLTLDARYRVLGYFNVDSDSEPANDDVDDQLDTPRVTHGFNIGLSYRF
jgi:opacity protein-like surface antigen